METPYYLINEKILQDNIFNFKNALKEYWPNSKLAYSVKTNSLPWLLSYLKKYEVLAEVVSDEEYLLAKKCGFQGKEIVFNGPIKSRNLIAQSLEEGAIVNIDSEREVEFIENLYNNEEYKIGVRININPKSFLKEDIGYAEDGFRFGFSEENGQLENALARLQKCQDISQIGLHLHCNSVTRSIEVYRVIAKYAANIIKKYSLKPQFIDIGGGFFGGVEGKPTAAEYLKVILEELKIAVEPQETLLIVEPGSAIIGSAVDLYTSVLDVKDTTYARIVTTDGSRIHIDPLWKKNKYMYSQELTDRKTFNGKQIICGYTCMDHDRIMSVENEKEFHVDDKIIYHRIGAYSMTFGGAFIRYLPEVYVNKVNGDCEIVRKRMSVEDYFNMQSIAIEKE